MHAEIGFEMISLQILPKLAICNESSYFPDDVIYMVGTKYIKLKVRWIMMHLMYLSIKRSSQA